MTSHALTVMDDHKRLQPDTW